MTVNDFSSYFDTQLNSYAVSAEFGSTDNPATIELDEYEKSLFLTKSEQDYVIDLYSGRNSLGASFEETEELRRYLATLVEEAELSPIRTSNGSPLGNGSSHVFFSLPDGKGNKPAVWFITLESVSIEDSKCKDHTSLEVVPAKQDEYHRLKRNPFRGPNSHRALRLDLSEGVIEIVSKFEVKKYYIRYLRRPKPIVLIDLKDSGLSISGESSVSQCELPEGLHERILEGAVLMALQSRGYTSSNNNKRE
jgi:hypothetical protein